MAKFFFTFKVFVMATRSIMRPESAFPPLLEDFFQPWNELFDNSRFWGRAARVPSVNIAENNDHYTLSLAAPGLRKEDFNIELKDNVLSISAEKEEKREEKEERYTRREYNYSSFSRSFPIPHDIHQENIEAKYEEGVLKLTLPKKEEAKKASTVKHLTVK